jgi:ABC-2 type transport system ATP-binding protein
MSDMILTANHLAKSFGSLHAVDDVSISVGLGEIYGLVGPDGAGKTTVLRLICGALRLNAGSVTIGTFRMDKQPEHARALIGYLSQRFSLYEDLTVIENIRFLAQARGLARRDWEGRAHEILAFVGLDTFGDRLAGRLSGGMKQKLALAVALVNRPQLLLLDEPTTGVDPVTRQDFWQLVIRLAGEQGMGVLVCTPYMDEATRCSRVGYLRGGKLIVEGPPHRLREMLRGRILELSGSPAGLLAEVARADPAVQNVQRFGDRLHLRIEAGQAEAVQARLAAQVSAAGGEVERIDAIQPLLEDVFIELAEERG